MGPAERDRPRLTKTRDNDPSCGTDGHFRPGLQPVDSAHVVVQACYDTEGETAVPVDQLLVQPGQKRPVLLLTPGEYRVVVQDEQGQELSRTRLNVPE